MASRGDYTYNQSLKKIIRHNTISYAIELLTSKRESACCLDRRYVRNIYDYYNFSENHSLNKMQTQKIDVSYITNWERLHDSYKKLLPHIEFFKCICEAKNNNKIWENIINNDQKNVDLIFEMTGSHYYSAINNRYDFI